MDPDLVTNPVVAALGGSGLVLAGLAIFRKLGLRASQDLLTLKEDAAERDILDRLQKEIDEKDERIQALEVTQLRFLMLCVRCCGYLAKCECQDQEMVGLRSQLNKECDQILGVNK